MWFTSIVPSTFTWLDTTTREQRRALEVIDLFTLRETVDQLGIGSVRDAWAKRLSPGTSTIQTRARYFFFVPWIYEAVRRDARRSGGAGARARRSELRLVDAILSADEGGVSELRNRAGTRRDLDSGGVKTASGAVEDARRPKDRARFPSALRDLVMAGGGR